jgi:hypothetical protein
MVSAEPDQAQRESLTMKLCSAPNRSWDLIMKQAADSGGTSLQDPANMKAISQVGTPCKIRRVLTGTQCGVSDREGCEGWAYIIMAFPLYMYAQWV